VLAGNVPGVKRCVDQLTWVERHTGMAYQPNGDIKDSAYRVML
jgi:hypothetical protein